MNLLKTLLSPLFWLLRQVAKVAFILVVILVIALASGNYWLPAVAKWQIRSRTGFRGHVESSTGSLLRGCVNFHDFSILNPKDAFQTAQFVSFNELMADVRLRSILVGAIALEKLVIDIDSVTLVKNADGVYNCQLFMKNVSDPTGTVKAAKGDSKNIDSEKSLPKIYLDRVIFAIKSVRIVDETGAESAKEYSLNYRREFRNVDDINSIAKPLISDLSKYGISVFIQSTIESVLHLPAVEQTAEGIIKVKDVSKNIIQDVGAGLKGLFKK